ncbi:hypothetical protein [Mastigocoleus testarum]|uniref:DUF4412 domain-containing protein n=1 Tax=Mastigocoleus testarum BC008 TaxID=371196 RepID=A0A0V7ZBE8_9CYAN|nr:hypothetical protein [Mastigocoleus testarum]KST61833.1 hypothetical protein BC008_07245 [Mastigocoleus testarum BC008]KST69604.1 hypothetical protein BC008_04695 [Mastigocoleus testarum BC008]
MKCIPKATAIIATTAFTLLFPSIAALAQAIAIDPVFDSPTPRTGPYLAQLGSTQAYVPMKHETVEVINGNSIVNHVLATKSGNLNMKGKIAMKCAAGRTVTYLAYRPNGQNLTTVVNGKTNTQSYTKTITMQPFSLIDLEKAGQQAFGGAWVSGNKHQNTEKTVKKTIKKSIEVRGKCSGLAEQVKSFPVTITVTFDDKDFPPPPVG